MEIFDKLVLWENISRDDFTLTSIPAVRKILIPPAGGPVVVEASVEGAAVEGAAVVSSSVVPTNIINTLNIDLQWNPTITWYHLSSQMLYKRFYLKYLQDSSPSSLKHNAFQNQILNMLTIRYNLLSHSSWSRCCRKDHLVLHVTHQNHGSFQNYVQAHEQEPISEKEMIIRYEPLALNKRMFRCFHSINLNLQNHLLPHVVVSHSGLCCS